MNNKALVDTNILVYATNKNSIFHQKAKSFLEKELPSYSLCLSLQNLIEFYAIITNPKKIEKPLTQNQAIVVIQKFIESGYFQIITPKNKTVFLLLNFLKKYKVEPLEIYDLHLAATVKDNNISTIYTADTVIFKKLGLKTINPLEQNFH